MRRVSFFLTPELDHGLQALKVRYGVPAAESIRRAVTVYLARKGVLKVSKKRTTKR